MDTARNMESLNSEIRSRLIKAGSSLVGFADMSELPAEVRDSMPSAISIAAALNPSIINEISNGPTKQYFQEYNRVNEFLTHLSETTVEYLKSRGHKAVAIKPTVAKEDMDYSTLATPLPNKTVATRAGLGWIGKSALLITKEYGPAVRLTSVLTDAEFETASPINESHCGDCTKCVENCPAKAIHGKNWELGSKRELMVDAFACCDTAASLSKNIGIVATICGICINSCPWTQKYISRQLTS